MGVRYVRSDNDRKISYIDANNLLGHSKYQMLPYDENIFEKDVKLESVLNTPDDSNIGYFIEVDLKYPNKRKEKTKNFPFLL